MRDILTFSIACVRGRYLSQAYRFVLELPADGTLGDLASFIIGTVNFDGDHLSYFYLANGPRGRKTWFTADGEWAGGDNDIWRIHLGDIFPLGRSKKLYYDYDVRSPWCFEIRKKGKATKSLLGREYPHLVLQEGVKPLEYGPDGDAADAG
ncbi:hypothetical protein ACFOLJ_05725 [Rugamonas sp. CCM 8940]|uniref:hypothetical protein n=1 Tax=Rugamonas sp. CCM 8940 TaxID=2765359 RepID=UPI0018F641B9|nr:hypothetical protein [Rugamonas sp. CCM 8940]MBJ7312777.1 hypothetical protein [Rugamonas sp. CCM 8940]